MPSNPRIDGPLTSDEQRMVLRIIQPFPGIDRSLIEGLVRLGYSESDTQGMLTALEQNANTARLRRADPKRILWINGALTALKERFEKALNTEQYDILFSIGYTPGEIGNSLLTNLLSPAQLVIRTISAHDSHECAKLSQLGYTDIDIRSLIRAGFTVSQLRALVNRVKDARRKGRDTQGLTIEQLDDMLFKDRPINEIRTLGIVPALLSGITSKMREGEVARCIIEYVTMFDVPYGPGGTDGQIDVGTRRTIVEVKVNSVRAKRSQQIYKIQNSNELNPFDTNEMRKFVIIYAPGYDKAPTANIQAIGGYVVKSCEELRKQIRELGGP